MRRRGVREGRDSTLSELVAAEAPQARLTPRSTCSSWNEISAPIRRRYAEGRIRKLIRSPSDEELAEVVANLDELCAGSPGSQLVEAIALYTSRAHLDHTAKCTVWTAASQRAREAYTRRTLPRYLPDPHPVTSRPRSAASTTCAPHRHLQPPSLAIVEYLAGRREPRAR